MASRRLWGCAAVILKRTNKDKSMAVAGRATIDGLLRRAAAIRPHNPALRDAPNRPLIIGGPVINLSWGELDGIVDAAAGRLRALGLPIDSVVATQFALSSEAVIALLAIARAGLIAAPVPLGWGRRETVQHLQRLGVRAILTTGRAGPVECADLMRHAAAECFSVRAVLSIGGPALDGVMALDDVLDAASEAEHFEVERADNPADHVVLVTADATAAGHVAVPRSHNELIAGGLAPFVSGAPDEGSVIAATLAPDTFAGLALQVVPWLMSGGQFVAHPPLALRALIDDVAESATSHLVLPAAAAESLERADPEALGSLRHVTLLARRGQEAAAAPGAGGDFARDAFLAVGEAGLIRIAGPDGAVPLGAEHDGQSATLIETRISAEGALMMRGAMVPLNAFPPGAEHGRPPYWFTDADGFRDTGVPATAGPTPKTMLLAGDAAGVVAVGGRRFAESDLHAAYAEAGGEIAPVVRADPLLGQRVAGVIGDGRAVVGLSQRLAETGVTPLGVPGGARQSGPLPFEDTRPKDTSPGRDALADTQAVLEQLLSVAKAAARR
ncbi:MAG: acyl--CoA ligase [Phreatobacter sp.]|uniref:AMP-binding protein n=1 Tax=Phreatobacter sp. TaxID=1966341 RepID=UPI001A63B4D7|nr:AMP-binding protein [Phreatobacter sp.]MBL8569621.1 acyl--CoA ligase [Phreatobacter sp.]